MCSHLYYITVCDTIYNKTSLVNSNHRSSMNACREQFSASKIENKGRLVVYSTSQSLYICSHVDSQIETFKRHVVSIDKNKKTLI